MPASIIRLKQTLLNLTLRLREAYVSRSLREEQLIATVADTAGPLRACAATLLELVERVDGEVTRLRQVAAEHTASLASLLLATASQDEAFLDSLLRDGVQRDEALLKQCAQVAIEHEPSRAEQLRSHLEELRTAQDALTRQVSMAVQTETDVLSEVVRALLGDTRTSASFIETALSYEPTWAATIRQWQRDPNWRQLTHLLTKIAQRHDALCTTLVSAGMQDGDKR